MTTWGFEPAKRVPQRHVTVEYLGATWVGEWAKYKEYKDRKGNVAPSRYLVLYKLIGDTLTPISSLNLKYNQIIVITNLITSKQVEKLQRTFRVSKTDDALALTERMLHKAWAGEWMGQATHNLDFCVEDLARILGKDFAVAWVLVATLKEQQKADIEGHVIIPWKK